jgi:HPt (histidine-containing phosphotransfer) domain-containing protein
LTAHALFGDREACLEAGMDEYMTKPIDRKDLNAILSRFGHKQPVKARFLPSSSMSYSNGCFDEPEFLDRCFGDLQTAIELVDYFIKGLPSNLENLNQACQQRDQNRLLAITHAIKGVAGYLSAKNLHRLTSEFHRNHRVSEETQLESLLADANLIRIEAERCLFEAKKLRRSLADKNVKAQ